MRVHLVNPSDIAFGTAVITPRWLYVLAAATPDAFGDPVICDETLEELDPACIGAGDVVGSRLRLRCQKLLLAQRISPVLIAFTHSQNAVGAPSDHAEQ